jgi:hypothetical protein
MWLSHICKNKCANAKVHLWRFLMKISSLFNAYKNQLSRQTGSRNLTGPKTLLTIWYTYMMLVTKYLGQTDRGKTVYTPYRGKRFWTHQIPTSCLPTVDFYTHWIYILYMPIFSEACDQISDSCHQYLFRKMWRNMCIYKCMLNVYKNQQNQQTGSRNLVGPKQ